MLDARPIPRSAGVYAILCLVSGRVYFGVSYDMKERVSSHKFALRAGNHSNKGMQRDFDAFGEAAFSCEVYKPMADLGERLALESQLIRNTSPELRYNHMYANGKCIMGNHVRSEMLTLHGRKLKATV